MVTYRHQTCRGTGSDFLLPEKSIFIEFNTNSAPRSTALPGWGAVSPHRTWIQHTRCADARDPTPGKDPRELRAPPQGCRGTVSLATGAPGPRRGTGRRGGAVEACLRTSSQPADFTLTVKWDGTHVPAQATRTRPQVRVRAGLRGPVP